MKISFKHTLIALAAAVAVSPAAYATNGYFAHGYGTKSEALAGAGVALPQDAMAAATNPAGEVWVGNRMDLGAAIFSPHRKYSATGTAGVADGTSCGANCPFEIGPQSIDSKNNYFLIPHFARNWMIDSNSSFSIAVYGNGGMNTEYQGGTAQHNDGTGTAVTTAGTFGGGTAGVDLMQLFVTPTYSRKINSRSSFGVSAVLAAQRFKAEGLSMFGGYSRSPNNLTNKGYSMSYGAGVRLGWQGEVANGLTLGAVYTSKIKMSKFDKYKGLFADQGGFDIPANATIGLAWKATPSSVLAFDIQKIWYSKIPSIANPISYLVGSSASCATGTASRCLGGSSGAGFGWRDMTVYKLGYQFQTSPKWTWRVGVSHGRQPIPGSEVVFNILAPAVIENHATGGFTYKYAKNKEFNFAAMYAFNKTVSGTNPLDPAQTIELKMHEYQVEASWGWQF